MKSLRSFRAALLALAFATAPAFAAELETPEQVLQYLDQQRRDVALASYSVRPDGTPDPADPMILFNPDQKMPLASTFKIVVLAAYAREVTAGRLNPDQGVSVGDWERYYLPGTDGGAHPAALGSLGIPADPYGFATDRAATATLDTLAHVMIQYSDNAATDYLMARVGRDNLRSIISQSGMTGQDVPLPILGTFLSWENHEDGVLTPARVRRIQKLAANPRRYAAQVDRLTAAFGKPRWRQAELEFQLATQDVFSYELEAAVANVFTGGTVRDYARVMAGVATSTFLSPEISALMGRHLEVHLPNENLFLSWGTKGGALAGVLTEANHYVPANGGFAGKPRVSVLFLRRIEPAPWEQLLTGSGITFFDARLAVDQAFVGLARQTLVQAP
jgi:D-alanyl-D-alanine carboxypeptidase